MGIFSRFKDIVSANINAMLDQAENPEKMIKLMIQEMEETLVELKSSCAGLMADRKMADREIGSILEQGDEWQERAELYLPGRVVTAQEVAETIAFLASQESSGVSGEAVMVALGSVG